MPVAPLGRPSLKLVPARDGPPWIRAPPRVPDVASDQEGSPMPEGKLAQAKGRLGLVLWSNQWWAMPGMASPEGLGAFLGVPSCSRYLSGSLSSWASQPGQQIR